MASKEIFDTLLSWGVFIHFKDNLKRELTKRGIPAVVKKQFIDDIFGKQVDDVKQKGLVDCESEEEFDERLEALKDKWNDMDKVYRAHGVISFFAWFKKEKVSIFGLDISYKVSIATKVPFNSN